MLLASGTKLGSYEILALIGAGGMGEVWKARDTKLDRDVAIKVLPAAVAQDPERLARFEREAKVLASLNHPNIATIHGVAESDNTRALVMELVDGNSPKGPLPFDEAWNIASQIITALEYAHERGIMHRDLKPANIIITPEGLVKLLDFGLAKAFSNQKEPSASPEHSPTLTLGATDMGVILGTAAYMAPEQARGKAVDKRADIWAFGVVLYELVTGERLFKGEDTAETLAAVIQKQPDLAKVPRQARRLLEECLQKDPKQRLRDIGDAKRLLVESAAAVAAAPVARPRRLPWIAAALLAIIAAALGFELYRTTRPVVHPFARFTDDLGAEISLASNFGPALAISPDGSRLAFVAAGEGTTTHLSVRLLASSKSVPLPGTDGASAPFFSPDSRWIGFFADQRLKKISAEGGAAVTLCDIQGTVRGASWGEDGYIWFAYQRSPLLRVSSTGGTPQPATVLDQQKAEVTHRLAQLLPGGRAFLFSSSKDNNIWEDASIQVQIVKSGQRKTLVQGGNFGRYLLGHLIYVHGGTLFAAPMDLRRLELIGPALPVIEDAMPHANNGFSEFDFTPSGTFVYIAGAGATGQRSLYWLEAGGSPQLLPAPPADYINPRASPDGTRIALDIVETGVTNLAVYELAQNRMTRLTFLKGGLSAASAWTPDGKHLLFATTSQDLSGPGLYWIRGDGAGEPIRLVEGQGLRPGSFSPDGKRLVYTHGVGPDYAIWTVPLDLTDPEHPKAEKPQSFLASKVQMFQPSFSPDGRWVAYWFGEGGQPEVYVRPFPGPGGKWQISTRGGSGPIWSRNGRELFFYQQNSIWVASYTATDGAFAASQPRVWSENAAVNGVFGLDLFPDGKRFIAAMPPVSAKTERRTHVAFLLNFGEELQRRTAGR